MAVAYKASGTFTAGQASITPPYPASPNAPAAGDIAILVVTSENQAISLTTANGFVELGSQATKSAGTAATDPGVRMAVYWKRCVGGDSNPVVADSGNNQAARIHLFSGVVSSGDPWDVYAEGNDSGANDTSGSIPGATTTVADTLVVLIAGSSYNATSTAHFSAWTNSDLGSLTERTDNTNTAGLGSGHGMATGTKATAGAYGATTVTYSATSYKGMMSIALKPETLTQVNKDLQLKWHTRAAVGQALQTKWHTRAIISNPITDQADEVETFESGSNGAELTTSSGIIDGGSGTTWTYSNEQALSGSLSAKVVDSAFSVRFITAAGTDQSDMAYRAYVYYPSSNADPTNGMGFFMPLIAAGTVTATVRIPAGATNIQLRDGTTTQIGSLLTLPKDQWFRVEVRIQGTTATLRVFSGTNLHGTTPSESTSGTLTNSGSARIRFGINAAPGSTQTIYYDDIGYNAGDWVGPSAAGGTPGGPELRAKWNTLAVAGQSLQTKWNVAVQGALSAVGQNLAAVWNTRATVGQSLQVKWNVRSLVTRSLSVLHNVRAAVSRTLQTRWNVRAAVARTLQVRHNVRAAVAQTLQVRHNVRAAVAQTLQVRHNVRALVARDLIVRHNVRAAVARTLQLVYRVRATAGQSLQTKWHVRQLVGANRQFVWNVRAVAGKSLSTLWNVASALTTVGRNLQLVWHTRAAVARELITRHNVRRLVSFSGTNILSSAVANADSGWAGAGTFSYDTTTPISGGSSAKVVGTGTGTPGLNVGFWDGAYDGVPFACSVTIRNDWNQAALFSANLDLYIGGVWQTQQLVAQKTLQPGETKVFAGLVNGRPGIDRVRLILRGPDNTTVAFTADDAYVAPALSLRSKWAVRVVAGQSLQVRWNVRALAARSLQTVWNVRAAVSRTLQAPWRVRALVSRTNTALWNVRQAVGQSVQLRWNVLSELALTPVGRDLIALWRVRQAVGANRAMLWRVRALTGRELAARWHVRQVTAAELELLWNDRVTVGKGVTAPWQVRAVAGRALSAPWAVRATVGRQLGLRWHVLVEYGVVWTWFEPLESSSSVEEPLASGTVREHNPGESSASSSEAGQSSMTGRISGQGSTQ